MKADKRRLRTRILRQYQRFTSVLISVLSASTENEKNFIYRR